MLEVVEQRFARQRDRTDYVGEATTGHEARVRVAHTRLSLDAFDEMKLTLLMRCSEAVTRSHTGVGRHVDMLVAHGCLERVPGTELGPRGSMCVRITAVGLGVIALAMSLGRVRYADTSQTNEEHADAAVYGPPDTPP